MTRPKIILLALFSCSAAALGAAHLLPTKLEVERSVHLEQAPDLVYSYINNPTEWPNWSMLNRKHDPSVIHLYGGPFEGKGARLQWSGDKLGNGQVLFTESISPNTIVYQQQITGETDHVRGYFTMEAERGGTRLTWRQQATLPPTLLAKVKGVLLKHRLEQEQEAGLSGLKTLLDSKSKKKTT